MTLSGFIDELLVKYKIVALGETHHGTHTLVYKNLLQQIASFDGIFLELPVNYQDSLDNFLKSGIMDKKLESFVLGAEKEGKDLKDDYQVIRQLAQVTDIPIICIDSSKEKFGEYQKESNIGRYFLKGKSRDEDMFSKIQEVYQKKGGKWLILGGSQHLKYGFHWRSDDMTLGSRLKKEFKDLFINICLWQILELEQIVCFKINNQEVEPELKDLLTKNNFSAYDENGQLYFEAYLIHP